MLKNENTTLKQKLAALKKFLPQDALDSGRVTPPSTTTKGPNPTLIIKPEPKKLRSEFALADDNNYDDNLTNLSICTICEEKLRSCVFQPCGHTVVCGGCLGKVQQKYNECPSAEPKLIQPKEFIFHKKIFLRVL